MRASVTRSPDCATPSLASMAWCKPRSQARSAMMRPVDSSTICTLPSATTYWRSRWYRCCAQSAWITASTAWRRVQSAGNGPIDVACAASCSASMRSRPVSARRTRISAVSSVKSTPSCSAAALSSAQTDKRLMPSAPTCADRISGVRASSMKTLSASSTMAIARPRSTGRCACVSVPRTLLSARCSRLARSPRALRSRR